MSGLQKILREPLLHFLALGAGLFLLYGVVGEPADERSDRIVVTEAKIGNLAQVFERTWRRPPTPAELGRPDRGPHQGGDLLSRGARARSRSRRHRDPSPAAPEDAVHQRGFAPQTEPTEAELRAFLAEHADRFRSPSRISFTQVYLSPDRRGEDAWSDAERLLVALNTGQSDPAEAGDPLLLEQDYRDLGAPDVERLLGQAFAARVVELPVGRWAGPVESGYGLHLVFVHERTPARLPDLDEIRDAVTREWRAARREEANRAFYEALRARYEVTVERPRSAGESKTRVAEDQ